ncbi:MAG: DUF3426 domain-containing protein [Pseudomonadota bacterium]
MMIIECEKCHSQYNLDENLLKESGSKLRCSQCKHIFVAYPPRPELPVEEPSLDEALEKEIEKAVALDIDTPSVGDEAMEEPVDGILGGISTDEFPELEEEKEEFETISPEELSVLEREAMVDVEKAVGRSKIMEEKFIREEAEEEKEIPVEKEIRAKKPSRSRVLTIVLLVILLLLGGAVAVFFLAPDLIPTSLSFLKPGKESKITDVGVRRLSFKAVNGLFVVTDVGKQLFVIKGEVTNNYPTPRSFILIMGSILDNKGQVLKRASVYAGNTFMETQIKGMSIEELNRGLRNRFGKGRTNFNIRPGGTVPFMIIFEDLPEDMSEFTVEGVSSSAGK